MYFKCQVHNVSFLYFSMVSGSFTSFAKLTINLDGNYGLSRNVIQTLKSKFAKPKINQKTNSVKSLLAIQYCLVVSGSKKVTLLVVLPRHLFLLSGGTVCANRSIAKALDRRTYKGPRYTSTQSS